MKVSAGESVLSRGNIMDRGCMDLGSRSSGGTNREISEVG